MSKAIYKRVIIIVLIALAINSFVFSYLYSSYNMKMTKMEMLSILREIDNNLDYEKDMQKEIEYLNSVIHIRNSRLTILDTNGNVIAETNKSIEKLDNHKNRPEFEEAKRGIVGISSRYSKSLNMNMLYIAKKSQNSENILRIAIPYSNNFIFIRALLTTIFITFIITLSLAMVISRKIIKKITEPLQELRTELLKIQSGEELNLKTYEYKELDDIAKAINILSKRVEDALNNVKEVNKRTEYILENMKDGLVFIDHNKNVIGINNSAREILDCKNRDKNLNIIYYTRNLNIIDAVDDAINKKIENNFDITLEDGRVIAVHISRVMKGVIEKDYNGAIILLIDVTSVRKNEEMRENFFANASHELKTPITSIKGYSELLTSDIPYSDEQKREFLCIIKKESDNMTSLINDILTISRIEAGDGKQNKININLKSMLNEIINVFKPQIAENNLIVNIDCEDINIFEEPKKFYALFNNLISNAIKYNVENGKVNISVKKQREKICIVVSDTGIGIPKVDQNRIFERFFRVDKGRSKKIGGTGLGLAIVKHIVNYYNGRIVLDSELDKGTKISVELNLKAL